VSSPEKRQGNYAKNVLAKVLPVVMSVVRERKLLEIAKSWKESRNRKTRIGSSVDIPQEAVSWQIPGRVEDR